MKNTNESKPKSLWKDRFWNLFLLLLGGFLTIITTHYFNYQQRENEKKSLVIVMEKEVSEHLKHLKAFAKGFESIKAGLFPQIGRKDVTLDRALEGGTTELAGGFGFSHRLVFFESIMPNLRILPPEIIQSIIKFHISMRICELNKIECEQAIKERIGRVVETPAPTCDVYLETIKVAISVGDSLLVGLSNFQ